MSLFDRSQNPTRRERDRRSRRGIVFRPTLESLDHRIVLSATPTTVLLSISPGGSQVSGSTVNMTATVVVDNGSSSSQYAGDGQVDFYSGSRLIGSTSVNHTATFSTNSLYLGNQALSAQFVGSSDENLAPSQSSVFNEAITPYIPSTSTSLITANASPAYGQAANFTAQVEPNSTGSSSNPSGTVQFLVDGTLFGPMVSTSPSATASFDSSTLPAGQHLITADFYLNNTSLDSSASSVITVTPVGTSTTVKVSSSSSTFGQSETLTATVAPNASGATAPAGQVQFFDNGNAVGLPVSLGSGTATLTTSGLPAGQNLITAAYRSSSTNFSASNDSSSPTVVTTQQAPLTVAASSASVVYGASIPALTASYSGFVNGDTVNSLGRPAGVSTTASASSLPGTYAVNAVGVFDTNYAITYVPGTLTVTPDGTTTSVTASNHSPIFGQPETFTATVTPTSPTSIAPYGNVQFEVDGVAFGGQVPFYGGQANYTDDLDQRGKSPDLGRLPALLNRLLR